MGSDFDFVEDQLPPGLSIIEASAGTGKTYAISHLVPRLLLEGTVTSLSEILLVTFTNDATRELSDRVRQVLQKLDSPAAEDEEQKANGIHRLRQKFNTSRHLEILRKALRDIDILSVSTIHSFCQRTLQSEGTLCGLPTIPELVPDASEFIETDLYELWKTLIASDEALAAVATYCKWSLGDDLKFVNMALSLEDPETVPPARDFESAFKELNQTPACFDDAACDEVEAVFKRVGDGWNNSGKDPSYRAEIIRRLREAKSLADHGFLEAVEAIAGCADWIAGRSKDGKALKAEVSRIALVVQAEQLLASLKRFLWDWRNHCVATVRVTVEAALHANRQITYDGLIDSLRDALRSSKGPLLASRLRTRYRVALIDESQDTDPRQFEIFTSVFVDAPASSRLVLIGDPKQAIYGFRGADVNTYLEAKRLAGDRMFPLNKTYRACGPLVEAINTFFSPTGSLLKEGLEFSPASSGLEHDVVLQLDGAPCEERVEVWLPNPSQQPDYKNNGDRLESITEAVATEIVRILSSQGAALVSIKPGDAEGERKPITPGDIAVLVSAGFEAEAMAAALHKRQVPAIVAKGADIMQSEEAAELLTLLRAITEPRRTGLRYAALATRLLGHDDAALRAIRDDAELDDRYLSTFQHWQNVHERQGIAPVLALIDQEEGISLRLARGASGERRVTNFRQLTDILQAASMEFGRKPEHLLRWFRQEIAGASDRADSDERQQQLESDADAVQIVTMHACKGLEYNLVFCPFLWSFRTPEGVQKISRTGQRPLLVNLGLEPDPSVVSQLYRNGIEDRLRLAYVAMTRAKVRLWICAGETAGKTGANALDWLLRDDEKINFETWLATTGADGRGVRHAAALEVMQNRCNRIRVTPPPAPNTAPWQPESMEKAAALAAQIAPRIPQPWGVTSFTSLTRTKHAQGEADPVSRDFLSRVEFPGAALDQPFASAPGGILMGIAVHDWIRQWDFSEATPSALETHLQRYELPSSDSPLHGNVTLMLNELRGAELPGLGCTVAEACPITDASEWHFQLPIHRTLSPRVLAKNFAEYGDNTARLYASRLADLSGDELAGFLQGFLDRLAFHEGTWGVVDWKTNKLGPNVESYGPEALLECAMDNHYLLQAHLYLVALRRYLGPDTPVAGAWLVFLRAVRADTGQGILHIQPKPELLCALDQLFFTPTAADLSCAK